MIRYACIIIMVPSSMFCLIYFSHSDHFILNKALVLFILDSHVEVYCGCHVEIVEWYSIDLVKQHTNFIILIFH